MDKLSPRLAKALISASTHLVALIGADGTIIDVGPSVRNLLGYEPEDVIGRSIFEMLISEDREPTAGMLAQDAIVAQSGDQASEFEVPGDFVGRDAQGREVWFECFRTNLLADPEVNGVLVIGTRVGPRHVLTDAISALAYDPGGYEAMKQLLSFLDESLPDTRSALWLGEGKGWIVNDESIIDLCDGAGPWEQVDHRHGLTTTALDNTGAFSPMLLAAAQRAGYAACWTVPLPLLDPSAYPRFERQDNSGRALPVPITLIDTDEPLGCLVVWSTESLLPSGPYLSTIERVGLFAEIALTRRRDREQIQDLVLHDHLTGALSRVGMGASIMNEAEFSAQILIDVDDFKRINDTHGHAVGDALLRLTTKRIAASLRSEDQIVRLGGDEFLVLLAEGDVNNVASAAKRLLAAFSVPFKIGKLTVTVGVSAGVAMTADEATLEATTDRADRAMYVAKQAGKNRWAIWRPDAHSPSGETIELGS